MMGNYTADWWGLLEVAVAVLLPLLVGLITRVNTAPGLQAVLLLFLSSVSGVLTLLLQSHQTNDVDFNLKTAIFNSVVTFIIAVAAHFGFWKPTQVARKAQLVGASQAEKRQFKT